MRSLLCSVTVFALGFGCSSNDSMVLEASNEDVRPADVAQALDSFDTLIGLDTADVGPDPALEPAGVLNMDLTLNVANFTGRAVIAMRGGSGAHLRVGGLGVTAVDVMSSDHSGPITPKIEAGALMLDGLGDPLEVTVEYTFEPKLKGQFEGYMSSGSTLLWPHFCENLYPCNPSPADGFTSRLAIEGLSDGQVAVHPERVDVDAPPYLLAFAVGDYTYERVGETPAGTEVGYWTLPSTTESAVSGTDGLVAAFDWFESTLGPYTLGSPVGPVAVDWGLFAVGGIEHHPRWHVSIPAFGSLEINIHEACHGWFGSGVMLECWEDLLLSEGLCDYLAARAMGEAVSVERANAMWTGYESGLKSLIDSNRDAIAWPATCEPDYDVLESGLFSKIPYYKGALFFREVAENIGHVELDTVISSFYLAHQNSGARLQDLIDQIALTGYDPEPAVTMWLRSLGYPQ